MKKNHTMLFVLAAAVAGYLILRGKFASAGNSENSDYSENFGASPIDMVFSANPENFLPPTINVSVTPQLPNTLAEQYVPLFGFVGIAQGETLQ